MGVLFFSPNSAINLPSLEKIRRGVCRGISSIFSTAGNFGLRYSKAPIKIKVAPLILNSADQRKNRSIGCVLGIVLM